MAVCSKASANFSAAGFINEQCDGTETGSAIALPDFLCFSHDLLEPKLFCLQSPPDLAHYNSPLQPNLGLPQMQTFGKVRSLLSSAKPRIAAIAPCTLRNSTCINFPRKWTSLTASARVIASAATSALYSPKECPAKYFLVQHHQL